MISGIAADTSTSALQLSENAKSLLSRTQELSGTATTLAEMSDRFQQTVGRFDVGEKVSAAKPTAKTVASERSKSATKGKKKA
jgi:hypothetical protein